MRARLVGPDALEWQEALARAPHDVFHLPSYTAVEAERLRGEGVAFLATSGDDAILAPLVLRPVPGSSCKDAVSPYGYSGPVSTTTDPAFWAQAVLALRSALEDADVVSCLLRLHPLLPDVSSYLEQVGTTVLHGETVSMDLTQPESVIEAGVRTNHRRNVNQARRRGAVTVFDDWDDYEDFLELYAETMDRVGASDDYRFAHDYILRLRDELPGTVHLASVRSEGRVTASAVLFEHQGQASYHLGASRTEELPRSPLKLLLDDSWRWARERGNEQFHLGGGLHGREDTSLFHFKAGFSPLRYPFSTFRLVVDVDEYTRLCRVLVGGPAATDLEFFPAYRLPIPAVSADLSVPSVSAEPG